LHISQHFAYKILQILKFSANLQLTAVTACWLHVQSRCWYD